MIQISDKEVFDTVMRVQESTQEFSGLTTEMLHVAALAAKSVLELLERRPITVATPNEDFPITFVEWAQQFALKTHYDRFLSIMEYLRQYEKTSIFTTSHIAQMYDKARWKKPANLADVFAKGAERIYFTEADTESEEGLKQWRLTRTGYEHLMSLKMEV